MKNMKYYLTAVCVYCGEIIVAKSHEEKLNTMIEHMAICEKHPGPILLEQVENLKCCGNCAKHHNGNGLQMDRCNSNIYEHYCTSHTPDLLTRKEREK